MKNKKYAVTNLIACLLFISFMLICTTAFAIEIDDKNFGFTLTLPDGFSDFPQGHSMPNAIYSYARYSSEGRPGIIIGIERMNGVIGQESILDEQGLAKIKSMLPEGAEVKNYPAQWQGFKVEGIETVMSMQGVSMMERAVQIPLRREAIQIAVIGPGDASGEVSLVMEQILSSLKGETDWK